MVLRCNGCDSAISSLPAVGIFAIKRRKRPLWVGCGHRLKFSFGHKQTSANGRFRRAPISSVLRSVDVCDEQRGQRRIRGIAREAAKASKDETIAEWSVAGSIFRLTCSPYISLRVSDRQTLAVGLSSGGAVCARSLPSLLHLFGCNDAKPKQQPPSIENISPKEPRIVEQAVCDFVA